MDGPSQDYTQNTDAPFQQQSQQNQQSNQGSQQQQQPKRENQFQGLIDAYETELHSVDESGCPNIAMLVRNGEYYFLITNPLTPSYRTIPSSWRCHRHSGRAYNEEDQGSHEGRHSRRGLSQCQLRWKTSRPSWQDPEERTRTNQHENVNSRCRFSA